MRDLTPEQKAERKAKKRAIALANLEKAKAKKMAMEGYKEGLKQAIENRLATLEELNARRTGVKQAFLEAFDDLGGKIGLLKWVRSDKRNTEKFYDKLLKILEQEKAAEGVGTKVTINFLGLQSQPVVIEGEQVNEEEGGVCQLEQLPM